MLEAIGVSEVAQRTGPEWEEESYPSCLCGDLTLCPGPQSRRRGYPPPASRALQQRSSSGTASVAPMPVPSRTAACSRVPVTPRAPPPPPSPPYISLLLPFPCLPLMFVLLRFLFRHFPSLILYPFSEWPCLFPQWLQVFLTLENASPASSEIQTHFSSLLPRHHHLSTPHGHFKLKSPTIIVFPTSSSSKLLYPNMNPFQFYPFWVPHSSSIWANQKPETCPLCLTSYI